MFLDNSFFALIVFCLMKKLLAIETTALSIASINPKTTQTLWSVIFEPQLLNITMSQTKTIELTINNIDPAWNNNYEFHILPTRKDLIKIENRKIFGSNIAQNLTQWKHNFTIDAIFLGHAMVHVDLYRPHMKVERAREFVRVTVLRNVGASDIVFKAIVGAFVSVIYISYGAALDLIDLKHILVKPVGPAIGFIGQYLIMPVLSYLIGYFLFPDMIALRLGLFLIGTTPGGGVSNVLTVLLDGNLNLSVAMTAISNLAAFGMMPIWIFTLGVLIFKDGNLDVPYKTIAYLSFSLLLPLTIGAVLQKCSPLISKRMTRFLKPISLILMISIIIFAFAVNTFMFKLFSWKIIFASSALPWIGYAIGWVMAKLCKQSSKDCLTIAIETGIQNTGIAIFMVNFTLEQPLADITNAVPVANSLMTPLPLLLIYICRKMYSCGNEYEVEKKPQMDEMKDHEIEAILQ
ncbi:sodium/bile acid cotransporter-like [Glossina fuscipes]|uniref:Sodium/bile acid cotransporter-like n=1 Tax=Glossina fuscipes TaxID=7396 RepID=A0A9C5ZJB2_9MUSC|nr:sodium/bile acid cotransporter-like [Glossina fuscipes]KAI9589434.1 hypothetical protein GQX74_007603 [Glossina fuscipes]